MNWPKPSSSFAIAGALTSITNRLTERLTTENTKNTEIRDLSVSKTLRDEPTEIAIHHEGKPWK